MKYSLNILYPALFLLILILAPTPSLGLAIPGPSSNEATMTYTSKDPSEVFEALGMDIDVSFNKYNYTEIASYLETHDNIKTALVRDLTYDLLLNPAPVYENDYTGELSKEDIAALEGVPVETIVSVEYNETSDTTHAEFGAYPGIGVNPFAFRDIRYAMNFLINREWVVRDLLGGYGEPKYFFLSLREPMMYYLLDIYLKYRFPYSVAIAEEYIDNTLEAIEAEKVDGLWYYDGEPINITFCIRIEDFRRDIGDRVSTLLENLGFTVTRLYLNFTDAANRVYFTDPREFQWHIYTEGWIIGAPVQLDRFHISFLGSAWFGVLPSTSWEYENETIENLTKQIYNGEFADFNDYLLKYRTATQMIIQESIRIWVADEYRIQVFADYVEGAVRGWRGIENILAIRSMINPSTNTIRIGYSDDTISSWSKSFTGNSYMRIWSSLEILVRNTISDPFVIVNPVTGAYNSFRAGYEVEATNEAPGISVPSNAIVWDAENDEWSLVGEGVYSKAVVRYNLSNLIGTHWHHGITITWADVLATWAYTWEIASDPVKSSIEDNSSYQEFFNNIKGIRIDTDENILEVYTDYYDPLIPETIAGEAQLPPLVPLELWEASSYLAFNLSDYALTFWRSRNDDIPLLDYSNSTHANNISSVLEEFYDNITVYNEVSKYTTIGTVNYLSYSEFQDRINATKDWIALHGNAWISDGAFYIDSINEDNINLAAFRDPLYPFTPEDFYQQAYQANITDINIDPLTIGEESEIYASIEGPEPLTVKYAVKIVGVLGVLYMGDAVQVSGETYRIDIPASLTSTLNNTTLYELVVVAFSKENATYDVAVAPLPVGPSVYTEDVVEGGTTETITANSTNTNVTVTVEANDTVSVYVSVFDQAEPVSDVEEPGGTEFTGYAVDVYVNDTDAVNWPIYVEIKYDETALPAGVSEGSLAIYYYNETTHSWKRCSNTGVDTVNNIVWAYITREEYEAGIGNVFGILGLPPGIGGELVLYNNKVREIPVLEIIFAVALALAGVIVYKRKSSKVWRG